MLILRVVHSFLPVITYPHLIKTLGIEKYGLVAFVISALQYGIILANFGFDISAVKDVSVHRHNKTKLSEIFSSILLVKALMLSIFFAVLTLLILFFDKFSQEWQALYLGLGFTVGQAMFCTWFFQGIEKMKYLTFINVIWRTIYTILVLMLIRQPEDYVLCLSIHSIGALVSAAFSMCIIFFQFKIKLIYVSLLTAKEYFMSSSHFFISHAFISAYTNTNVFVITLLFGNQAAGIYSAAEKLFSILNIIFGLVSQVLYPYMIVRRNIRLFKKIFTYTFLLSIIIYLFSMFSGVYVFKWFLSKELEIISEANKIFQLFCIQGIIMVVNNFTGNPLLSAFGYSSYTNYSTVVASITHITLLLVIWKLALLNVYIVAYVGILTQMIIMIIRMYGVKKKIINNENKELKKP